MKQLSILPMVTSVALATAHSRNSKSRSFRYRDGRPLLALCQGELEGANSLMLSFFEIGSDGKMHEAPRSIFPWAIASLS